MKKICLVLIAGLFLAVAGCDQPKVSEPDPAGFLPVEALKADDASSGSGPGSGPQESESVLPPQ